MFGPSSQKAGHIQKELSSLKFVHKWEGPQITKEVCNSGYILISQAELQDLLPPTNAK